MLVLRWWLSIGVWGDVDGGGGVGVGEWGVETEWGVVGEGEREGAVVVREGVEEGGEGVDWVGGGGWGVVVGGEVVGRECDGQGVAVAGGSTCQWLRTGGGVECDGFGAEAGGFVGEFEVVAVGGEGEGGCLCGGVWE